MKRIYLCGAINGRSDEECRGWRSVAKALYRGECLDPMARDYRGTEKQNVVEIVEGDKAAIDSCDALLVMFDRPSVGTSMEILYAWEEGKPVVLVDVSGQTLSPWLLYHVEAVFHRLESAIAALNTSE